MKFTTLDFVFVLTLALLLWVGRGPNVPPAPPHEPAVAKVAAALSGHPAKAKTLAAFYLEFAKTGPALPTVGDFASAHKKGLLELPAVAKAPPMVGAEVDAALAEIIGLDQDASLEGKRVVLAARLLDLGHALEEVR